jgi:hypothetical protein
MKLIAISALLLLLSTAVQAEECAELNMCISQSQRQELSDQQKRLVAKAANVFLDEGTREYYRGLLREFERCMNKNDQPTTPRLAYLFCLNNDILSLKIEHDLLEVDPENPDATTYVVEYTR